MVLKYFDRAFAVTLAVFTIGSLVGGLATEFSPTFRQLMVSLISTRIVAPVLYVSALGGLAVMFLVFFNNCITVTLSFLFPFVVARWKPPISNDIRGLLLTTFSILTAGLLGFFNLGASVALVLKIGGLTKISRLLTTSWLHAPLEFLFILLCVAEPYRVALCERAKAEMSWFNVDLTLLAICILGLLASAMIEVFAGV